MKKFYTLLLICITGFSSKAQYTITSASNPVVGDVEYYNQLDSVGLFHGSSGTGQTWNYTSVSISTLATLPTTYVATSSIPNNFLFPGATIGTNDGFGSYNVYSNNATKIEILGFAAASASNCLLYSNPIKLYSLPFTYGTVSPDNFAFSATGYTVTGTFTNTGDGTGTLQLPSGTFPNVLKQKIVLYETVNYGSGVDTYTLIESRYYSATSKFPLLVVDTQTATTVSGTTTTSYYKGGQINGALVTGITEQNKEFTDFTIFPNPNSNGNVNLVFSLQANEDCELIVFNSLGQNVKTITYSSLSAGIINKNIDLSELESGIYYLKLRAGKEEQAKRLTITK